MTVPGIYESLLRPLLFRFEPEKAHQFAASFLETAGRLPGATRLLSSTFHFEHPSLETTVAGLRFPNPIGLAAGFDKDCRLAGILPAFGFGFIELGTVTPRPQPGNPAPRLFRVPEKGALINRLGFNNEGCAAAATRLAALGEHRVPIGINIGMNSDTPPERAARDYAEAFSALRPYGDYFVINVSSPNTPGLRELQERMKLERILTAVKSVNKDRKPIFVKLAPDIDFQQLAGLIPLLLHEADGIVATNTTQSRDDLPERWADVRGGMSGAPLRDLSTRVIAEIHRMVGGKLPIIGVGGVFSAEDAYQKLRAGASLVQIYTGWIYKGPGLIRDIKRGLAGILQSHGLSSVRDAVGRSADVPVGATLSPSPITRERAGRDL